MAMSKKARLLFLPIAVAVFVVIGVFTKRCVILPPDLLVLNPAAKQLAVFGRKICFSGPIVSDTTGWSSGSCLIPGACQTTSSLMLWQADFKFATVKEIKFADDRNFVCKNRAFFKEEDVPRVFEPHDPQSVDLRLPEPFLSCEAPALFGSPAFQRGFPVGWVYSYGLYGQISAYGKILKLERVPEFSFAGDHGE